MGAGAMISFDVGYRAVFFMDSFFDWFVFTAKSIAHAITNIKVQHLQSDPWGGCTGQYFVSLLAAWIGIK